MENIPSISSFPSLTLTCGDVPKPIVTENLPFYECNIHIYDYDVYYGSGATMRAIAKKNAVLIFKKGNLKDIFFQNYTAGSNATVVFAGTVPNAFTDKYTKY